MTHPPVALAHLLDLSEGDAWGGPVILHGAGSRALAARFRHRASRRQAAALEWLSELIG